MKMIVRAVWLSKVITFVYCNVISISTNITENKGFTLEQGIPHLNTQPYFLNPPTKEVTTLEGQSAYLHCRVAQLGDKKVSWIRTRDLHVLTSGLHTFASDQRFIALHAHRSENWTLHIRFSQTRDSGEYQCQVNTEPKLSMAYYLHVQEATTVVEGSDQRYVRAGSTIQLSCKAPFAWQPPGLLYWYHDTEILHNKGRISIATHLGNDTYSNLVIENAKINDTGNYTCWPTKFLPASVMVHVLPDEIAAAKSLGISNKMGGPFTTKDLTPTSSAMPMTSPLVLLLLFLYLSSILQMPNR